MTWTIRLESPLVVGCSEEVSRDLPSYLWLSLAPTFSRKIFRKLYCFLLPSLSHTHIEISSGSAMMGMCTLAFHTMNHADFETRQPSHFVLKFSSVPRILCVVTSLPVANFLKQVKKCVCVTEFLFLTKTHIWHFWGYLKYSIKMIIHICRYYIIYNDSLTHSPQQKCTLVIWWYAFFNFSVRGTFHTHNDREMAHESIERGHYVWPLTCTQKRSAWYT